MSYHSRGFLYKSGALPLSYAGEAGGLRCRAPGPCEAGWGFDKATPFYRAAGFAARASARLCLRLAVPPPGCAPGGLHPAAPARLRRLVSPPCSGRGRVRPRDRWSAAPGLGARCCGPFRLDAIAGRERPTPRRPQARPVPRAAAADTMCSGERIRRPCWRPGRSRHTGTSVRRCRTRRSRGS